jgi:hypothetical protein
MRDEKEPLVKSITPEQLIEKMESAIQLMTEFNNEVGREALVSCGVDPVEETRTLWFLAVDELTERETKLIPAEHRGLPTRIIFQGDTKP